MEIPKDQPVAAQVRANAAQTLKPFASSVHHPRGPCRKERSPQLSISSALPAVRTGVQTWQCWCGLPVLCVQVASPIASLSSHSDPWPFYIATAISECHVVLQSQRASKPGSLRGAA